VVSPEKEYEAFPVIYLYNVTEDDSGKLVRESVHEYYTAFIRVTYPDEFGYVNTSRTEDIEMVPCQDLTNTKF
jgi:hypothetical protein